MSFLSEFNTQRREMENAFQAATSPHSWRQIIAPRVRAAIEVKYCYSWIDQVNLEPEIQSRTGVGEYLSQMFANTPDDETTKETKSVARRPATQLPIFEAIRSRQAAAEDSEKANRKPSDQTEQNTQKSGKGHFSSQGFSRKQCASVKQVYAQGQTAPKECLNRWIDDPTQKPIESTKCQSPVTPVVRQYASPSKINQSKGKVKKQCRTIVPLADFQQHGRKQWQQALEQKVKQSVEKAIYPLQTQSISERKKPQADFIHCKPNPSNTSMKLPVCPSQDHSLRIPQSMLNDLLRLSQGNRQTQKIVNAEENSRKQARLPQNLEPQDKRNSKFDILSSMPEQAKQSSELAAESSKKQLHNKPSQPLFDSGSKVQRESLEGLESDSNKSEFVASNKIQMPTIEPPEFPPVKKHIIDELQASGRRTALKSESKDVNNDAVNLDEDELAETLKRIIDEQARRQGINV